MTRTFVGQEQGQAVCTWLNSSAVKRNDPIARLVELERRRVEEGEDTRVEIQTLITRLVSTWRIGEYPQAVTDGPDWTIRYSLDWNRRIPTKQITAFLGALKLAEFGLLSRVRQCRRAECAKFFFAILPAQLYHQRQCMLTVLKHDVVQRRKRALQMREYRRLRKEGKVA